MNGDKIILDACCGGRMFWFNKSHPNALYIDNRISKPEKMSNGAIFGVSPDTVMDLRKLAFKDNTFSLVVFDPPHILWRGNNGFMTKKYGYLDRKTWRDDLKKGFSECFRVLKKNGVLIFKWSEFDIPTKDVISLFPVPPLFGHPSGKAAKTHWLCFMKIPPQ